ncbi:MAG: aminopeptidase [Thermoanaerobaculia bacterium]|nr:aminopeptidase [Thermoanaerobaculia bacterium]
MPRSEPGGRRRGARPHRARARRRGGVGAADRRRRAWRWPAALALVAAAASAACASLAYTTQAVLGGATLLAKRRPVERVLARGELSDVERDRLRRVGAMRAFARDELALPVGDAYTSFVALGREAVTWNVVATGELDLAPETWCFPVAGCVGYRGYFRERGARRFAGRLAARGHDVAVTEAIAYSSLGWFDDPVLDTFLALPEWQLAGLLFHELAHRALYVGDDTAFNESFATAVEELGLDRWLARQGDDAQRQEALVARREERRFDALRLATRAELAALYASPADDDAKRAGKRRILAAFRDAHRRLRAAGELGARWDGWLALEVNNAHLAAAADYTLWVPAFVALHAERGGDFPAFYAAARELGELPAARREERLAALSAPTAKVGAATAEPLDR